MDERKKEEQKDKIKQNLLSGSASTKKDISSAKTLGTTETGSSEEPKKKKKSTLLSTFTKLAPAILGAVSGNSQAINASAQLFSRDSLIAAEEQKILEAKRKAALEERKVSQTDRRLDITEDQNKAQGERADRSFDLQQKRVGFEEQRLEDSQAQQSIDNQFSRAKIANSAKALEIQEQNAKLREQEIGIKASQKTAAEKTKALEKLDKQKKENKELEIPGVGIALTKDDAKAGKKVLATTNNAMETLKAMMDLRKEFGSEVTNREAVQKGKSLAKNLQLIIKGEEFAGLGVLTGPDLALLEAIVPSDPLQFNLTGATEAKFAEAERLIRTKANTFFESKGLDSPFKRHPRAGQQVRVNGKVFTVGDKGELIE